jgi:CRISPR/Cas system-associated exonuclease Cas4 (RecB family)
MAWQRAQPYVPGQKEPFKISRSKIDFFLECPRCFWLDARLKIKRPDTPPFQINKAIDELFKIEFDGYRLKGKPHPIMKSAGLDAVPFSHEKLDDWRHNFTGVQRMHIPTNLLVFGAVDDIWVGTDGAVMVVDYKATSKKEGVNLDADWQKAYKRQLEVYQWLLRGNNLEVSNTGYFVYTNALVNDKGFFDTLSFETKLIPYTGSDEWIEPTLEKIKICLDSDIPEVGRGYMGNGCEYCAYARSRTELTLDALRKK